MASLFSCLSPQIDEKPTLWVVNGSSVRDKVKPNTSDREWKMLGSSYFPSRFATLDAANRPENAIFLTSAMLNSRLAAQKGGFSLHGSNSKSIEEQYGDIMGVINFPIGSHIEIQDDLDWLGVTETTAYPEIEYLGREVARKERKVV